MEGCRRKPRRYDVRRQVWEVGDISTVEEIIERREKLAPRDSGIGEALRDNGGLGEGIGIKNVFSRLNGLRANAETAV